MKLNKILKIMWVLGLLSLGVSMSLSGCSGDDDKTPVGVENQVLIKDFKFQPQDITVKAGDTVTWVNEDNTVHTVEGSGMDSGNMSKGVEFKYTFDKAGTYDYICGPHPYMTGTVIVE